MKGSPLLFLFGVVALWATIRGWMSWPDAPPPAPAARIRWAPPLPPRPVAAASSTVARRLTRPLPRVVAEAALPAAAAVPRRPATAPLRADAPDEPAAAPAAWLRPDPLAPAARRVQIASWAILRRGVGDPLAPGGQLAGSQAGARLTLPLAPGLAAAARLSGPLRGGPGVEAALGLDARLGAVTLAVERRLPLDGGGRGAVALTLFGGVDRVALPARLQLSAFGQLGMVGLRRRDGFIDGAARIERPIGHGLEAGLGVWGGAQPGAARIDVGPSLAVRTGRFRLAAEWRQRIAGAAQPGSGPVLTLGADF